MKSLEKCIACSSAIFDAHNAGYDVFMLYYECSKIDKMAWNSLGGH